MLKDLVKFYENQIVKADNVRTMVNANKDYFQTCHGDYGYYSNDLTDVEKADGRNSGRLISIYDLNNPIAA